jgi:hypothetical protein
MDETKKPNPRPQAPKGADFLHGDAPPKRVRDIAAEEADYMKRHPELLYRVAVKKEDSNDDS